MRRPSSRHLQRFADIAVPAGVGIFLWLVAGDSGDVQSDGLLALAFALAVAQGAALTWRRRRPELVMAATLVGGLGYQLIIPEIVMPIAGLFAIWSLASARPPQASLPGLVALEALIALNFFTTTVEDTVFTMVVAAGIWALAEAARNRRTAIREEARRAVSEEQARIARELHDVIAHSVSVIVVQAGAGRRRVRRTPRPGARRPALDRGSGARRAARAAPAADRGAP